MGRLLLQNGRLFLFSFLYVCCFVFVLWWGFLQNGSYMTNPTAATMICILNIKGLL